VAFRTHLGRHDQADTSHRSSSPPADKVAGSASIAASLARKTGLTGKSARVSLAAVVSGAKSVVIARGSAGAKGGVVKLKLAPTKAGKRAVKRLHKAVVTIAVSQGAASAKATLKLT
jgi:hypothetical protein